MRRRLAVMALAPVTLAVLAASAACGTGAKTATASGAQRSASAQPSASLTASPNNTPQVCGAINQAVAADAKAFGADVGTMVGHLTGGNKTAADKAKQSALGRLSHLAGQIRTAAGPAEDPHLTDAAQTSATNLDALVADQTLLASVKAASDLPVVIEKVTSATNPLNRVCV